MRHIANPTRAGLRSCLLLLAGASTILPADAPAPSWQTLKQEVRAASANGSLQQAEELLRSAIAGANDGESGDTVMLWIQLAAVHRTELKMDDAAIDYQRGMEANRLRRHPSAADAAVLQNNLGTLAQARREWKAAESRFRNAYASLADNHLLETGIGGSVLSNLGVELHRQGRFKEAGQAFEQAFAFFRQGNAEKTAQFANLLSNWGLLSLETGSFADAAAKQRRAWEIQSVLPDITKRDQVFTLNNLALTLVRLAQFPEAESLNLKAMALLRSGDTSTTGLIAAETLNNLAVLEKKMGRVAAAEQHEREALELAVRSPQNSDAILASIWNNQGMLALDRSDLRSAKRLFEKAAEFRLRESGTYTPDYASVLANMADLQARSGNRKQAIKLLSNALEIDQTRLGPNHWKVANDLANLARQHYFQKNFHESVTLYERAGAIEETTYGAAHRDVGRLWRNLAITYEAAKRNGDSEKTYAKAIHAFENSSGSDSTDLYRCLREHALLLRKMQRFSEAEQADVRASGIQVRNAIRAEKANTPLSAGLTVQP